MLTRNGKAPGSAANDHEGQKFVDTGERDKRSCSRTQNLAQVCWSLRNGGSRPLVRVVPDDSTPPLFRVEWPDIALSPPANLTRAMEAAGRRAEQRAFTDLRKKRGVGALKSQRFFSWSRSLVRPNGRGGQ